MIGFDCLKWRLSFDVADRHRVYRSHSIQVTPIMSSRNLHNFEWNKFEIVTIDSVNIHLYNVVINSDELDDKF